MSKFDSEFEYLEDELEYEEFISKRKKRIIIVSSILGVIVLAFLCLFIFVQDPRPSHPLTLENDFSTVQDRLDEYYPN